jgi:hypothetical protein
MENTENRKNCENCRGTGRVNGHSEERQINASMVPIHSETVSVWVDEKCATCNGTGVLELKWTPSQS